MNGIDYYNERPVQTAPTLSEVLAGMTTEQKTGVLNAYAHRPKRRSVLWCKHNLKIRKVSVIAWLYVKIEEIEIAMKKVMTSNIEGVDPPTTSVQLRNYVQDNYASENTGDANDFNLAQCEAIATKIVTMSKYEGGATFTWYKNNVSYP